MQMIRIKTINLADRPIKINMCYLVKIIEKMLALAKKLYIIATSTNERQENEH